MAAHNESPTEPGIAEISFYFGTGAFVSFVLVATIGLSIMGHHLTADVRNERVAAAAAASEADELEHGAEIYARQCASCHGAEGGGGVGPSFEGVVDRIPEIGAHIETVTLGRGRMPVFGGILSDAQIELVVRFEREVLNG